MNNNNKYKMYENLAFLTHIGVMMVVPIFAGVYIGKFIDDKLGTGSLFLFVFIAVGVLTAFTNLYRITIKRIDKRK